MKILMVNKFFYIKGGSETYYFSLKRLLEQNGHEVIDFSMQDDKNFDSSYSELFVDHIDYNGSSNIFEKFRLAKNIIYSKQAKQRIEELIKMTKPDIIHLHIFQHQLSSSILDVIKKYNIPTVYTAHDLKMLCPNYIMMTNGEVCEKCQNGHYINCTRYKCIKDSYAKSVIGSIEGYVEKWRNSYDVIDKIITPSKFYRDKFIEFGIKPDRVVHIPNFLDKDCPNINRDNNIEEYFLYFGRLSKEKGVLTLINAMKGINKNLYIVGTGPVEKEIINLINRHKLSNIKLLGYKRGQELSDIVGNCLAVILPSEWYENGPYSAIETLQIGKPIIGANIAGIPELIKGNGFLFKPKDSENLHRILCDFPSKESQMYIKLCENSKKIFNNKYTSEIHYKNLMEVYNQVLNNNIEGRNLID